MHSTISFSRQQRITNTRLLNASFIENLGLMHGKMGIAIYFFHLARENKNPVYENYAGELIVEIYEEIRLVLKPLWILKMDWPELVGELNIWYSNHFCKWVQISRSI